MTQSRSQCHSGKMKPVLGSKKSLKGSCRKLQANRGRLGLSCMMHAGLDIPGKALRGERGVWILFCRDMIHSFGLVCMSLHSNLNNNININISNLSVELVSSNFSPLRSDHELFCSIFSKIIPHYKSQVSILKFLCVITSLKSARHIFSCKCLVKINDWMKSK